MKHKILIAALMIASAGLQSCDDFLTQKNHHQMTTDIFYSSLSDCDKGLNAVYNAFKNGNIYQPVDENLRSDLGVEGSKKRTSFVNEAYKQNFNDANATCRAKWSALYTGIFRVNQLLQGIEKVRPGVTGEEQIEKLKQIEAQAYFMRGLFYFWLNNSFNKGNVPYIDYVPQEESDFYRGTTDSKTIIKNYRADINKALELGLNDKWEGNDIGRVTSWAAKAVLGKSYLYDEDYEIAETYFADIIQNGGFKLVENIGDNFTAANEFNSESLLEVSYSTTYNTEFGDWSESTQYNIWGMSFGKPGAWSTILPSFWLVEEYENEYVDQKDPSNWIEMSADEFKEADEAGITYKRDLIYDQLGKTFYYEYLNEKGDTLFCQTYVYHQFKGQNDYDPLPCKRLVKKNPQTGELYQAINGKTNPQYIKFNNKYFKRKNFITKWESDKVYRLRQYSKRASYSLAINGDEDLMYYQNIPQVKAAFHNNESGYFRKFTNWDTLENEQSGTPPKASGINLRLIRLADIYLMYAECLIKGGNDASRLQEAIDYVNEVRYRAGTMLIGDEYSGKYRGERTYQNTVIDDDNNTADDTLIDTPQELMEHLMYVERPLELSVEGNAIRVVDLRRWGVTKQRFEYLSQQGFVLKEIRYLKPKVNNSEDLELVANWGKQYRAAEYPEEVAWFDYTNAAINYGESVAYWPIPNIESTSNPEINN